MSRDRVPHDKAGWSGIYHVAHVSCEFTAILPPQASECWDYRCDYRWPERFFTATCGGTGTWWRKGRGPAKHPTVQRRALALTRQACKANRTTGKGMALGTQSMPGVLGVVSNEIVLLFQTGEEGSGTQNSSKCIPRLF